MAKCRARSRSLYGLLPYNKHYYLNPSVTYGTSTLTHAPCDPSLADHTTASELALDTEVIVPCSTLGYGLRMAPEFVL